MVTYMEASRLNFVPEAAGQRTKEKRGKITDGGSDAGPWVCRGMSRCRSIEVELGSTGCGAKDKGNTGEQQRRKRERAQVSDWTQGCGARGGPGIQRVDDRKSRYV